MGCLLIKGEKTERNKRLKIVTGKLRAACASDEKVTIIVIHAMKAGTL